MKKVPKVIRVPKVLIYFYALVFGFVIFAGGCKKDDDKNITLPVLTTSAVNDITQTSVICGGNITSDGGSTITARGVCWSTGTTPAITDNKTSDSMGGGSFSSILSSLNSNTTYYVRAYATNIAGTAYGNTQSFILWLNMSGPSVNDIDGNVYKSVTIGKQIWMSENLKVTRYNNGDSIPNVIDDTTWNHLTSGAFYNNTIYGKLYNWYAVSGSPNVCPTGWHVPTDAEWSTLISYLGGEDVAGSSLKDTGTTNWASTNFATNESGFTALPGGCRLAGDLIFHNGHGCAWWTATKYDSGKAWYRSLFYNDGKVRRNYNALTSGFSVRCVKD
jgi:uncharacterized protein (TIGR02145 family)